MASTIPEHRPVRLTVHPAARRSPWRRALSWLSNLLLLGCVLVFLLLAVGPHLFGYRTATMLTGSMEPGISPGDVVVTVPRPAEDVAVGDVITYHIPVEDHRVETHRITEVRHRADGSIVVRTKGDNNSNVDPWVATLEGDTVWEVALVVPKAGAAIRTLRSPVVSDVLFWGSLGGVLLVGLSLIWGRRDEEPTDEVDDQPVDGDAGAPAEDVRESRPALVVVPPTDEDVFDASALGEVSDEPGGGEVGRRFAARYRQLLPQRITRVAEAVSVGDVDVAVDAALSLKVTSMTVGAVELADVARQLEERLRDGDVAGCRDLADRLAPAASRAHGALSAYLAA
jgi:signal peptidase I